MAPTPFTVERSRLVPAPAARIYPLLVDFHRWTAWSPWEDIDPGMSRSYGGSEAGVGATYAWSGNRKAGSGSMEIIEAVEPSDLRIRLLFLKPFKAENTTFFELRPEGEGTRVTWRLHGQNAGLAKLFGMLVNMDRLVGKDFEKGLARIAERAS